MFIYLAGPITATKDRTVSDNVASAVAIYLQLTAAKVWSFCPQLSALVPEAFDIHYERWMEYDFFIIERCDGVLMLPNWETSSGAKREHELAGSLGKRIFYSVSELLEEMSG